MKIIGSILIVVASIFCAFTYEKKLKEQEKRVKDLISFVNYVKNKILYFSTPIKEIIDGYEDKNDISNYINEDFSQLDKADSQIVKNFFSNLGQGFKSEQIALCDYTDSQLNKSLNCINEKNPNKIKIFRAFSLFASISLIIFII